MFILPDRFYICSGVLRTGRRDCYRTAAHRSCECSNALATRQGKDLVSAHSTKLLGTCKPLAMELV